MLFLQIVDGAQIAASILPQPNFGRLVLQCRAAVVAFVEVSLKVCLFIIAKSICQEVFDGVGIAGRSCHGLVNFRFFLKC